MLIASVADRLALRGSGELSDAAREALKALAAALSAQPVAPRLCPALLASLAVGGGGQGLLQVLVISPSPHGRVIVTVSDGEALVKARTDPGQAAGILDVAVFDVVQCSWVCEVYDDFILPRITSMDPRGARPDQPTARIGTPVKVEQGSGQWWRLYPDWTAPPPPLPLVVRSTKSRSAGAARTGSQLEEGTPTVKQTTGARRGAPM